MDISWQNENELWAHFDFDELTEQYDWRKHNDVTEFLMQHLPQMIVDVSKEIDGVITTGIMSVGVYLESDGLTLQFFEVQQPDSEDVEDNAQEGEYDQRFPGLELQCPNKKDDNRETDYGKQTPVKEENSDGQDVPNPSADNAEHKLLIFQFQNIYQMSEFVVNADLASTTLRSNIYKDKKLYFLVLNGYISKGLLNRCTECANSIFPQQKQKNSSLRERYLQEHGELIMTDSDGKSPMQILSEL